jgi:hypothetical protein
MIREAFRSPYREVEVGKELFRGPQMGSDLRSVRLMEDWLCMTRDL